MAERLETVPRGVFVLGMHRSGTSAMMRALTLLGLPACTESDFIPGLVGNPRGHYESATLMRVNERLLKDAGGFWWVPPSDEALAEAGREPGRRTAARAQFLTAHTTDQWACKDPRCCLTLDFWAAALALSPIVVAVSRNPLEVASSLRKRDEKEKRLGLAIWERYTRSMLAQMRGRPVFLSDYNDLLDDPIAWCETAHGFLVRSGCDLPPLRPEPVVDSLEPQLRHRRATGDDLQSDHDISSAQRDLYELVLEHGGTTDSFVGVPVPGDDGFMAREFRRDRRLGSRLRRRLQGPRDEAAAR